MANDVQCQCGHFYKDHSRITRWEWSEEQGQRTDDWWPCQKRNCKCNDFIEVPEVVPNG